MTKNEAQAAGKEAGTLQAERMMNEEYVRVTDQDAATVQAGVYASMASADAKIRSTVWHEAYKAAFLRVYYERHNALPEVKAAYRKRSIEHSLDYLKAGAEETLASFKTKFDENPLYAFEWSSGAIEAAAKMDVAIRLQGIVAHPEGGHEKAVEYAVEQTMRGARWPSRSTSGVSNITKEAVTAAYAEFAAKFMGGKEGM